jgi:hypothetical protein
MSNETRNSVREPGVAALLAACDAAFAADRADAMTSRYGGTTSEVRE